MIICRLMTHAAAWQQAPSPAASKCAVGGGSTTHLTTMLPDQAPQRDVHPPQHSVRGVITWGHHTAGPPIGHHTRQCSAVRGLCSLCQTAGAEVAGSHCNACISNQCLAPRPHAPSRDSACMRCYDQHSSAWFCSQQCSADDGHAGMVSLIHEQAARGLAGHMNSPTWMRCEQCTQHTQTSA